MNMEQALSRAAGKAKRQPAQDTIDRLDALSRTRALTDAESTQLYNAIKTVKQDAAAVRSHHRWTPAKDRRLIHLRNMGNSFGEIAKALDMSRGAVNSRYIRIKRGAA